MDNSQLEILYSQRSKRGENKNLSKNRLKIIKYLPKLISKKERYFIILFSFLFFIGLILIPIDYYYKVTKPVPNFGGSFKEGMVGQIRFINPILAQSDTDRDLTQLIYSGLLKNDGKGNFIGDLAENFEISDDNLSYKFYLRKNIKWHDGEKFTADDVLFTISTIQNQEYGSLYTTNWQGVEVSKIDDFTIKFSLKNPYAQFLNSLTIGILPKHIWQNLKPANFGLSENNLKPIGSGPYKFSKLKKDRSGRIFSYELISNKDYYLGRPFVDKIEFKFYNSEEDLINAFNQREIDNIGIISEEKNIKKIRFLGRLNVEKIKIPRYFALFFNQNQSRVLADKNVRLALAYSINKDNLINENENLSGTAIKVDSPILPEIFNFNLDFKKYEYNPEFAIQILENSNWRDSDGDGVREKEIVIKGEGGKQNKTTNEKLELNITVPMKEELIEVAKSLVNQWGKVGIKVNLNVFPISELQQNIIKNRDYQILLFGEVLGLQIDPFGFWHSSQKKDPGLNLALYDNKSADKILEDARQTFDPQIRAKKYDDFQKLVIEDLPAIFLYSPKLMYFYSKKIKGFDVELLGLPQERFINIDKWYIETKRIKKG